MKFSHFLMATALVAAVGCRGCDDGSGSTDPNNQPNNGANNGGSNNDVCEDNDEDGYPAGLTCTGRVDCDDTDPDVRPGVEEICGDGVDNDCNDGIDEGCPTCQPGESRDCGQEGGRCQLGRQTCSESGVWSVCTGSEGPFEEVCNGLDDDCDGEVDENGDLLCDDGRVCTGVEACVDGACVAGDAVDCSTMDGPCTTGECSEKDGGCRAFEKENGSACEDGNFCTVTGTCDTGQCVTTARDCSSEDDACNVGVCDENADACVKQPRSDGTTCDDGEFCTVGDTCSSGTCGGGARDCSAAGDQCNEGVCDEAADACATMPVADDTACEDGQYCTVNDTCQGGSCTPGGPRSCSAQGGSCRDGTCDEATDSCTGDPVPDGTACDDGQFCTISDACAAGTCVGGGPRDCSGAGSACRLGTCNENLNACATTAAPDGTTCDDGAFCTAGDTCNNGVCGGSPRDCSSVANACNSGSCNETTDACVPQPRSDGTACPDNLFCTTNETCQAGSCSTMPRNCSTAADQCNDGMCNDTTDACVPVARPNGTACNDGQFCTGTDSCQSGACIGGAPPDCSAAAMGNPCLIPSCNVATQMCVATPDPVCCDVNVDADLDGSNQCDDCDDSNGAAYPGAPEFCNGFDDDCDGAVDEDFDGDSDGFSICATDPSLFDCDDTNPDANPGTPESCNDGAGGNTGNGIDDDCDGYVDEGCNPCTTNDQDRDGWSECDGDCNDSDAAIYPTRAEVCDGKDNDCNVFTIDNCGVSDSCNHDLDGDRSNDPDRCRDDMLCACVLGNNGSCNGDYRCTPFCNSSDTGPLFDGCATNETCSLRLVASANVDGCSVASSPPGTRRGGAICSSASQCRSGTCDRMCVGPGCRDDICHDGCTSDARCDASAVCRIRQVTPVTGPPRMEGACWPDGGPFLGSTPVGGTCTADSGCDHGECATDPNTSAQYCTQPCCTDSNCPGGYTCSLRGGAVTVGTIDGNTATSTVPQCIRDVAGQGSRVAGQACTANSQCASNFCERDVGVCVDPCCADSTCPSGLTCELQWVQTTSATTVTQARVCMNLSTEAVIHRK